MGNSPYSWEGFIIYYHDLITMYGNERACEEYLIN